jgi:hypothetical protein
VATKWQRSKPVTVEDVLAAVVPGRVTRLDLTAKQKRAFRDRDGRIGLDVLRHLDGSRVSLGCQSGRFSLEEDAFQAVARRLGHNISDKRCRAVIRRLIEADVLHPAGSYRQKYTNTGTRDRYRVKVYKLTAIFQGVRSAALSSSNHLVGRTDPVKTKNRVRW